MPRIVAPQNTFRKCCCFSLLILDESLLLFSLLYRQDTAKVFVLTFVHIDVNYDVYMLLDFERCFYREKKVNHFPNFGSLPFIRGQLKTYSD